MRHCDGTADEHPLLSYFGLLSAFDLLAQERQALDRAHGGFGLEQAIVRSITMLDGGSATASSDGPDIVTA